LLGHGRALFIEQMLWQGHRNANVAQVGWPARQLYKVDLALRNSFLVCALVLRISRPASSEPGADREVSVAYMHVYPAGGALLDRLRFIWGQP
jgi:hypothetical protein